MDEHVRVELSRILQEYADASGVFITAMRMNWLDLGRNKKGHMRKQLQDAEYDAIYDVARDPKRRSDPGVL